MRRKLVAEAIAPKPWQDMQVNVEYFLPGRLAICQEQVDALRFQTGSSDSRRKSLCCFEERTADA
jgi:hypothetical protein